jgi:hypothetical protein
MPYVTKGQCVYKKSTGKKVGCTEGSVEKYLAALHANVQDSVNESMNFKNVIVTDNKTEASVYYTLSDNPSTEIALVFNLGKQEDSSLEADYAFGVIKDSKGAVQRFEDPLEAKKILKQYGLKPDDIERKGQESYEIIEDELNQLNSTDGVKEEAVSFNSLYNKLINS